MEGITDMVHGLLNNASFVDEIKDLFAGKQKAIGRCPRCGGAVVENRKGFVCSNHSCRFALWKDNRFFSSKHKELTTPIPAAPLKDGHTPIKGLYSEKTGKSYNATVVLDDAGGQYVNFKLKFGKG